MTVNNLPKSTLLLWQIRTVVINIIVLAICLYFRTGTIWPLRLYGVFTVFCLLFIIFYLPRYIKGYKIRLISDAVIIQSGVIVKSTHIMPYSRLIYTQSFTSPLAKKLGLTAISLKAARSLIFVPELEKKDAELIMRMLSEGEE